MSDVPVAIAHDYLTQRGGAERVVLALARAFPAAPIYTTLYSPDDTYPDFQDLDVRTSWLNQVPYFRRHHRAALPLLPLISSSIYVDADVVIASSSGWAHGFRTRGQKAVYCYSPARWLYEPGRYLGNNAPLLKRSALRILGAPLRRWDQRSARKADSYLAISTVVQQRIERIYGRSAAILPAPHSMTIAPRDRTYKLPRSVPCEPYFLVVSRLLPYKNVGQTIDAFAMRPNLRLVVVGSGPEKAELVRRAPANVIFLEKLPEDEMESLYANCVGLLAASFEDFGLTPLEAAAHGKPSAVLRWGGFLDTVVEGETGVFFESPDPGLIAKAVDQLLARAWNPTLMHARAERFSEPVFADAIRQEVERLASASAGHRTQ